MRIALDLECNALENPDIIWVAVCRNIDDLEDVHVFERPDQNPEGLQALLESARSIVGHNIIGYDWPILHQHHIIHSEDISKLLDTLVVSRFLNFRRPGGHSLEALGAELGVAKQGLNVVDWTVYSEVFKERCLSDTLINAKVFLKWEKYVNDPKYTEALKLEHDTAVICLDLYRTGFPFHRKRATELHSNLSKRLEELDRTLLDAFPPKTEKVGELTPRETKHGTIHGGDFARLLRYGYTPADICLGQTYDLLLEVPFNPGSHKQIIERLNEAGWKPTEKTDGHIDFLKAKEKDPDRKKHFETFGWKIIEENLKTVPETAPEAARRLSERLILAARVRRLEEWLGLCTASSGPLNTPSIHARFNGIGTWTHRKSTSEPNMQNVPVAKRTKKDTPLETYFHDLSDQMRELWCAPHGWRLVGTDADGIQMRVFAHYVNDERLIEALVSGDKDKGTDIHTLHWKALGDTCKGRDPAKTFIYAWLLGAGAGKVAEILECAIGSAKQAVERFLGFYPGLKELKRSRIPFDARRGYFEGLDGRPVICSSEHEMLGGYLQNGESIIMKTACRKWRQDLRVAGLPFYQVNDVHDEWQTLVPDDPDTVDFVGKTQVAAIVAAGQMLKLNCPLNGQYKSGYSWKETH